MRRLVLIALLVASAASADAQRAAQPTLVRSPGQNRIAHQRAFFPPVFFADAFYPDAFFTPAPVAPQPPVIVVQAPSPAYTPEPAAPPEPLMIELQGDRYVRVSGEESSAEMTRQSLANEQSQQDLPPAILIFRDGHRQEVSDYTIANGILYARADYYTDGSWNKNIELSSLDLPQTIASNRSRGITFRLPAAPNEVITRP